MVGMMDGKMEGWVDGWMEGCMDACMTGWMDGWMDGWIDEWMRMHQVYPAEMIIHCKEKQDHQYLCTSLHLSLYIYMYITANPVFFHSLELGVLIHGWKQQFRSNIHKYKIVNDFYGNEF